MRHFSIKNSEPESYYQQGFGIQKETLKAIVTAVLLLFLLLYFVHYIYLLYTLCHLHPPKPTPTTCNHHTIVLVYESFFFFARSLNPLTVPQNGQPDLYV